MNTEKETIEDKETPPTHYWIRKEKRASVRKWQIIEVNMRNIHIINDPEHFGYNIVPVPTNPKALKAEREKIIEEIDKEECCCGGTGEENGSCIKLSLLKGKIS